MGAFSLAQYDEKASLRFPDFSLSFFRTMRTND